MIFCSLGVGSSNYATIDSHISFFMSNIIIVDIFCLGAATPKSPTLRSPTMSGSPLGSAQNSDVEHDSRIPGLF